MNPHWYEPHQAAGHGRWQTCRDCGVSKHGGYYWLAGYKSRSEPRCTPYELDPKWIDGAIKVPLEQN